MTKSQPTTVGIDDMALYVPRLYLPIRTIAEKRGIAYEKLNKGLGLENMAIPDVHEDAATMAANAVVELIEKNSLRPDQIGRIYLGTESALDGAKPTATYVLEMLRRKYRDTFGTECFLHCDVVDLTFACVGGVDALQNTLDWVRNDPDRIGIVVCSDFAKYELASTGEYTQGAGAIAMLVKHQPRLLHIEDTFGVATRAAHDFFKPKRKFSKAQIIREVLDLAGLSHISTESILQKLPDSLDIHGFLDQNDEVLFLHKDTPVFDGPYSNQTYQNRIREAFLDFQNKKGDTRGFSLDRWARLIFHLPYAAHGRRIATEIFMLDLKQKGQWRQWSQQNDLPEPNASDFETPADFEKAYAQFLRALSKTDAYQNFVREKLRPAEYASAQIGNMYACSIFLALMSTLETDFLAENDLSGQTFGFFGYGSGSKSKVFEGLIQPQWREVVAGFRIRQKLNDRVPLDYETYEALHKLARTQSVCPPNGTFRLAKISDHPTRAGARYYEWIEKKEGKNSAPAADMQHDLAR